MEVELPTYLRLYNSMSGQLNPGEIALAQGHSIHHISPDVLDFSSHLSSPTSFS